MGFESDPGRTVTARESGDGENEVMSLQLQCTCLLVTAGSCVHLSRYADSRNADVACCPRNLGLIQCSGALDGIVAIPSGELGWLCCLHCEGRMVERRSTPPIRLGARVALKQGQGVEDSRFPDPLYPEKR